MKKILLFITTITTLNFNAQTFPVGHMSVNFNDASRTTAGYSISGGITLPGSGRPVGSEIYYPATTAGNNTSVANGQFPVVVIGHGFVMTWDGYDNVYNQLASHGYIVLLPRTEGGFSPTHSEFGADLRFLANEGMNLNTISTSTALTTFNGKVIAKSAIGGHSMGAGCSFLGAASNTSITCLFNFAAATTNPSSISSASLVTVPTLMISGARDCVADTTVQNSHYSALNSSKKFHVILNQLTHCDFGNGSNTNCVLGQSTSGCGNQVSNALAFPRYMNYLQNFLDNQLKNDCQAGQRFMDSIQSNSSLRAGRKITGTIACAATGIQQSSLLNHFDIFPNPTEGKLTITFNTADLNLVLFELYDISGRLILQTTEQTNLSKEHRKELNIDYLDKGTYILQITQNNLKKVYKIIKQ